MEILVVGSGGREHSIVSHLLRFNKNAKIHVIPGNDGMEDDVIRVNDLSEVDIDGIVNYVKKKSIQYVFIGPELPMALGLWDQLNNLSIPTFGVSKAASKLETSKVFAKSVMKCYNIPTANYRVFTSIEQVKYFFEKEDIIFPKVIKADGLAFGKGVIIVNSKQEALDTFYELMVEKKFNDAANLVIMEDYIEGEELSAFVLFDKNTFLDMAYVKDYKKLNEGDKGPNTGGMGSYMPVEISSVISETIKNSIINNLCKAFKELSFEYKGLLYIGLKINKEKVSVLEFNVRLGDPEAQVILSLLETNLIDVLKGIYENKLSHMKLKWKNKYAVCIVLAKKGYPNNVIKDELFIKNLEMIKNEENTYIFHAGTKKRDMEFYAVKGRVLNIVSIGDTISNAKKRAYYASSKVRFDHMHYRLDIANDIL